MPTLSNIADVLQPAGFPTLPANWTEEELRVKSPVDGMSLRTRLLLRKESRHGRTVRLLVIIHGLGEHGGRYQHLPHFLESNVDAVYCADMRGHGHSPGTRGHVGRFDDFATDTVAIVEAALAAVAHRLGNPPVEAHLLGHSMGGLIVLRTLFLHPDLKICSAIVSAPFLGMQVEVPLVKELVATILARFWRSLPLETGLDPSACSRDPAVVTAYRKDSLVHSKMTPGLFEELQRALADTVGRKSGITVPLLFLVPLADRLVDSRATLHFFEALSHRRKQLKTYPGLYHEALNEPEKEQVLADLLTWLTAH